MKVTGPMFSLEASGTVGGVITASKWKGRAYFRTRVTPANPRSAQQTAQRAMWKFITQIWSHMSAGDQASWDTLGGQRSISPFNAYTKFNQDRWTHFSGAQVQPTNGGSITPTAPGVSVPVAGVKQITVSTTANGSDGTDFGAILFAKKGSAPAGVKTEVVAVVPFGIENYDALPATFIHTGLTTGDTWHYKWKTFSIEGLSSALGADASAVVL